MRRPGEKLGRKKTTVIAEIITIIGATLQATSYGLGQMITARIITGIGAGQITATVPVWAVSATSFGTRAYLLNKLYLG